VFSSVDHLGGEQTLHNLCLLAFIIIGLVIGLLAEAEIQGHPVGYLVLTFGLVGKII